MIYSYSRDPKKRNKGRHARKMIDLRLRGLHQRYFAPSPIAMAKHRLRLSFVCPKTARTAQENHHPCAAAHMVKFRGDRNNEITSPFDII